MRGGGNRGGSGVQTLAGLSALCFLCGGLLLAQEAAPVTPSTAGAGVTVDLSENGVDLPKPKESVPAATAATKSGAMSLKESGSTDLVVRGKQQEEPKTEVAVTTVAESPYLPQENTAALRIPMKTVETPASVQVIDSQLIEDQDDQRVTDALRNVAGVSPQKNEGYAINYENSFIRGFDQNIFRNGYRTYAISNVDMATVERIEVIKGPSSVNNGWTEPGGVVNVVTKKAELTPIKNKQTVTVGSYGYVKETIDSGGMVADNKAYRMIFSYGRSDSFRDYVDRESFTFAPSFLWKYKDNTTIELATNYNHTRKDLDNGVPFWRTTGEPASSINAFYGDPASPGAFIDDVSTDLKITHELAPYAKLRTIAQHHYFHNDLQVVRVGTTPSATGTLTRNFDGSDCYLNEEVVAQELLLDYEDNDMLKNNFLIGTEGRWLAYEYQNWTSSVSAISMTKPVYGYRTNTWTSTGTTNTNNTYLSPYAQNVTKFFDERLILSLGGRLDSVWQDEISRVRVRSNSYDYAPTGSVGLLYKLFSHLYPYGTISNSFKPQATNGMTYSGERIDPETGTQYEAGFKSPFNDERFVFTNSFFRIDKDNVAGTDPNHTDYKVNAGKMRSQGFEFTAQGEVLPGWDIIGTYAYTDTEVLESNLYRIGSSFINVPRNSGSLWLVHRHEEGALKGLRYGAGTNLVDYRPGNYDYGSGYFVLPAYMTWDMMVGYRREFKHDRAIRAQMNIKNVSDQKYYESVSNSTSSAAYMVMPGSPLMVSFTLGLEF